MTGMSKDKSPVHFILFHDNISRRSPYPGRVYSLAGHLIEMSKDKEADQILDTLVGYVRMFLEHCKGYKYLNTRYFISSAMLW